MVMSLRTIDAALTQTNQRISLAEDQTCAHLRQISCRCLPEIRECTTVSETWIVIVTVVDAIGTVTVTSVTDALVTGVRATINGQQTSLGALLQKNAITSLQEIDGGNLVLSPIMEIDVQTGLVLHHLRMILSLLGHLYLPVTLIQSMIKFPLL